MDEAKTRLETLIGKVKAKLPDGGKIYLATISYIAENAAYNNTGKKQEELDAIVDTYNDEVKAIADADDMITLADINSQLTLSDLKDGIHSNDGGYYKMGAYWYSLIKDEIINRINEMSE